MVETILAHTFDLRGEILDGSVYHAGLLSIDSILHMFDLQQNRLNHFLCIVERIIELLTNELDVSLVDGHGVESGKRFLVATLLGVQSTFKAIAMFAPVLQLFGLELLCLLRPRESSRR